MARLAQALVLAIARGASEIVSEFERSLRSNGSFQLRHAPSDELADTTPASPDAGPLIEEARELVEAAIPNVRRSRRGR